MTTRATLLSALALVALCASSVASDDSRALKRFKASWRASVQAPVSERLRCFEHLLGTDTPAAAELIMQVGLDPAQPYPIHDRAFETLCSFSGPKVRAWVTTRGPKLRLTLRRVIIARLVAKYPPEMAIATLKRLLEDKSEQVRGAAIEELEGFREASVVEAIIGAMGEQTGSLVHCCHNALRALTGQAGPRSATEWRAWWRGVADSFDFSEVEANIAKQHEEAAGKTRKLSTSADGSGLYESITSERIVFVVDVSGSMRVKVETGDGESMTRLDYVKRELSAAIEGQLDKDCLFNVVIFSSEVRSFKSKLVPASKRNKAAALRYLKSLEHDGMTNAHGALQASLKDPRVDTVYFLSDGSPTAGKATIPGEIMGAMRKWTRSRSVKVHAIAFLAGDGAALGVIENKEAAKAFMKALGESHRGSYRLVD